MPERILLVRMSSLGDVIHATPVARALKRALPNCHLAWLVFERMAAPLLGNPHLDEVITVPDRPSLRDLLGVWWRLKTGEFTVAIDFEGILRGAAATWASGAFRRIGKPRTLWEAQFAYNEWAPALEQCAYISQHYLQVCTSFGVDLNDYHPELFLSSEELGAADEKLSSRGLDGRQPTVALVMFSTERKRQWPENYFIALGNALVERLGARLFIPGTAAERPRAEAIAGRMKQPAVVFAGETNFRQAAALLARADLVVGLDTGLTHAAFALDRPLVCLIGRTPLSNGPTGPRARTVYAPDITCRPCPRARPCPEPACMRNIIPEQVLSATLELAATCGLS